MNPLLKLFASAAAAALASNAYAGTLDQPWGSLSIATGDSLLVLDMSADYAWTEPGWSIADPATPIVFDTAEGRVEVSGFLDRDPSIAYAISVTDFGAPSVFSFNFGTPIIPVTGASTVRATLSGTLRDTLGDGVAFVPTAGPFAQVSAVNGVNMGVDIGPAFAAGPAVGGTNYTYGTFSSAPIAGPPGAWSFLSTSLSFGLSGGLDSATMSGYAEIMPVPEPATWLGLLAGLGALGATRLRRGKH